MKIIVQVGRHCISIYVFSAESLGQGNKTVFWRIFWKIVVCQWKCTPWEAEGLNRVLKSCCYFACVMRVCVMRGK